jgi:hypothetical protein
VKETVLHGPSDAGKERLSINGKSPTHSSKPNFGGLLLTALRQECLRSLNHPARNAHCS